jgi:hypothetical protein
LRLAQSLLSHFGDIQVAQFSYAIHKEYVGTFDVPMDDFVGMEHFQSLQDFICNFPDILFLKA